MQIQQISLLHLNDAENKVVQHIKKNIEYRCQKICHLLNETTRTNTKLNNKIWFKMKSEALKETMNNIIEAAVLTKLNKWKDDDELQLQSTCNAKKSICSDEHDEQAKHFKRASAIHLAFIFTIH